MKDKEAIYEKSYTAHIFLSAIQDAKDHNYDEAMKAGVLAVAGVAVCFDSGDFSCIDLLDDIIGFLDTVTSMHPDRILREQRMCDALSIAISSLEKLSNNSDSNILNLIVRYLFRSVIAFERIGKINLAYQNEKKAFSIIRKLNIENKTTCWLEISKLYVHKGKRYLAKDLCSHNALRYIEKAFHIAHRGCRKATMQYRNACYQQMLACCFSLIRLHSSHNIIQAIKWFLLLILTLSKWIISKIVIGITLFFHWITSHLKKILARYGWFALQLIYITWLFWLVYIAITQINHS